jgi:ribosomal protein S18 acetylase RimI-like enzyme
MITLRPAIFSDYAAIARLHAKSWQQTYRGIFTDHFLDHDAEKDRAEIWQNRLRHPLSNQVVALAVQDETIVGFSCLYLNDDPLLGSLLDNLHVSPSFQQAGIGRMLIKNCATTILENGKNHKMYLWVFELNQKAIKVYEHLGGTNVGTEEKQNPDGTSARVCEYVWNDVASLCSER